MKAIRTLKSIAIGLADIHIGDGNYSSKYPKSTDFLSCGVPFISAGDFRNGRISSEKFRFISEDQHATLLKGQIEPGDVLIVSRGNGVGQVAFVDPVFSGCNINAQLVLLRCNSSTIHNLFLYYLLSSKKYQRLMLNYTSGSAQPQFTIKAIKQIPLQLPELPEQKAIAHILGTLDNKIELNRKMNETLEAMAQAMFKSWFVDFDPVMDNALAKGNEIPEELKAKADRRKAVLESGKYKPLPKDIQALFPSSFEYNDKLGKWIPGGWESHDLGSITTELRRGVSPKYTEEENGVLVLNQRCIRNHEINFSLARKNDPTKKKVDGRFLEIGDVLVNSTGTGTLGRIANVVSLEKPTIVDSHVTVVRNDKSKVATKYFNCLMFSIESHIEAMGEGSTGQTELSRARLSELRVLLASRTIQDVIEEYLESIYLKKDANKFSNQNLVKTRDVLLSQLISGKTRLPESFIQQFESQKEPVS